MVRRRCACHALRPTFSDADFDDPFMKQDKAHAPKHPPNSVRSDSALLRIALVAGLLWYSLLGWLIATSDQVSLNVRQIAESDAIVQASVGVNGGVSVKKSWRGHVENGPLDVEFPDEVARPGQFIIPLRRTARGWEITQTHTANGTRLVYPASENAVEKLEELLGKKN
jgi:hypothetical protein